MPRTRKRSKRSKRSKRTRGKNKDKIVLWGVGIEAEFALFHDPRVSLNPKKPRFLFFDPQKSFDKPMQRFYYYFYTRPPPRDKKLVFFPPRVQNALTKSQNIDVEHAGKLCKGKVVVGQNYDYVYYLLEARTDTPFSGKDYGPKYLENYVGQLQKNVNDFVTAYKRFRPEYQKKENKTRGPPTIYPYGMSSRINLRNLNTNKFSNGPVIENYTGSYHFTFTLPHTYPGSCEVLSKNHRYFANLIQWVEPLIATAFHSCDDRSIGQSDRYTKGSFRVVMAAWGDFGGSDVRRIRCVKGRKRKGPVPEAEKESLALSRYATHKVRWRDDLPFKNIELLDPCREEKHLKDAQNSLGADFRTPYMRYQEKRKEYDLQALEVRIFDWFHPKHLTVLSRLLVMLAERSRTHRERKYVYRNKYWNDSVRQVMIHGWNAKLTQKYVDELEKVFGFEINPRNLQAYSVLQAFVKALFKSTKSGEWTKMLLKKRYKTAPTMPKVNRRSWEYGYATYLLENRDALSKLRRFAREICKKKEWQHAELRKLYRRIIGGSNWADNFVDVLGFLQTHKIISWKFNYEGDLESVRSYPVKLRKLTNMRKLWLYYMSG